MQNVILTECLKGCILHTYFCKLYVGQSTGMLIRILKFVTAQSFKGNKSFRNFAMTLHKISTYSSTKVEDWWMMIQYLGLRLRRHSWHGADTKTVSIWPQADGSLEGHIVLLLQRCCGCRHRLLLLLRHDAGQEWGGGKLRQLLWAAVFFFLIAVVS